MKENNKWPDVRDALRDIVRGLLLVLGMLLLVVGGLLLGRAVQQEVRERFGSLSSNRACLPSPGPGWSCRHLEPPQEKAD